MINKKVLLLGGSGYVGQHIAELLSRQNEFNIAIGDIANAFEGKYDFIQLDVLDSNALSNAIRDFDFIINCTGQITKPINTSFKLNTRGIDNIIESVIQFNKKLIHISTVAVYGTREVADESSELNPENPYATCKAFAEYSITTRIQPDNFCILRLSNLYGENQPKGFFSYLHRSFHSDRKLIFNNDGSLTRYFLHVKDCSYAILLSLQKNLSGVYNVSSNEKFSIEEIIRKVESITGRKFETDFAAQKPIGNIDVLKRKLFTSQTGFQPNHSIDELIETKF